jgi:O-antigen ligase
MEPMTPVQRVFGMHAATVPAGPETTVPSRPHGAAAPWAVAAALVALAVAVDPLGLRPHTSLRWFLVSTAISVAALSVARGRCAPLPRWFVTAGTILVTCMVLAAALVGDPATAWLGHPQRHLGVLAWLVFAAAAVVGAGLPRSGPASAVLPAAALVAAVATGATAAADLGGWSPLGDRFGGGRIGGLLGQPTTLGAVAVMLLPLVSVAPVGRRARIAAVAGLLLAVIGTQTRGAVVGLVAAGLVSLPALDPRSRRRVALLGVGVVLVVAASPVGHRLLGAGDSGRVDEWRVAARVIADEPWLGVGPEGYRIAVLGALDPGYVERYGRDVVVDRAHSAPLDVAAAGGWVAGAAYLVLVAGVAVATRRLASRGPWSLPAAAGAGAVGVLAAGFLAFPVPEVDALAWLLAGMAVSAAAVEHRRGHGAGRAVPIAASLLVVCLVAGATDVTADRQLARARERTADGDHAGSVSAADRATRLRPDLVDGWYVAAQVAAAGPTVLDLDAGIERAAAGLRRSPDDPALRTLHAVLVGERAVRTRLERDRTEALRVLDAALGDDPTHPALLARRAAVREVGP